MLREVPRSDDSDDDFDIPDDFWDDVPETNPVAVNPIPELMDTPLVQALPEMKKLENYGGNSYQANLELALQRAKLLRQRLRMAAPGTGFDPFGFNMVGPSTDLRDFLPGSPKDENLWDLASAAGLDTLTFSRAISGSNYSGNYADLGFFLGFLKNDDPSKNLDDVLDSLLARGVKFTPNENSLSGAEMFGSVTVPYKVVRNSDNRIVGSRPAIDDLDGYTEGLSKLANFRKNHSMTPGFNTDRVSIEIAPNQADFEARVAKYSKIQRDLSRTQGINIPLKNNGEELLKSDENANDYRAVKSKIIINHEFARSQDATFGGDNSISETLLHEYGHTVHRSLGNMWGISRQLPNGTIENNIDPDYERVFSVDVSNYGSNNHMEHFAESFANYLQTGLATPEYKDYLKTKLRISAIDLTTVPEVLRGNNFVETFVNDINNNPKMNGYKFVLDDSSGSLSEAQIRQLATALNDPSRSVPNFSVNIKGYFLDPQGRKIQQKNQSGTPAETVSRTLNFDSEGLYVYHGLFNLPDDAQGTGLGTAFVDSSFEYYKKMGIPKVKVWAALSNGAYQWALMDFQWDYSYIDTRMKRDAAINYAKNNYQVLEKYLSNAQFYDQLSPESVSFSMAQDFTAAMVAAPVSWEIQEIIQNMRNNGWTVTNDLLNQIKSILSKNPEDVTPLELANIGRGNKKIGGKKASSLGRLIMKHINDWHGYKDM